MEWGGVETRGEEKGRTDVGREEERREGGGLFKGVPGRRGEKGGGNLEGEELWAAFRKALLGASAPRIATPLPGPLFSGVRF